MSAPLGLAEEVALERAAIAEHEREAARLWQLRFYGASLEQRAKAEEARERLRELLGR